MNRRDLQPQRFERFAEAYADCLRLLIRDGTAADPRGQPTVEALNCSFTLTNPRARTLSARRYSVTYAIAESLWYLLGRDDSAWISHHAKLWASIAKDGRNASGYGPRWRAQFLRVVDELRDANSTSRRAVINILSPGDHEANPKDVPCTIALQYLVRDGKLHATTYMRSCDVVWGMPSDVFAFTVFQEVLALLIGVPVGDYTHVVTSLHLYEDKRHRAMEALIDLDTREQPPPMQLMTSPIPLMSLEAAEWALRSTMAISTTNAAGVHSRYWHNWFLALAARRAKVLGDATAEDQCWAAMTDAGLREARPLEAK